MLPRHLLLLASTLLATACSTTPGSSGLLPSDKGIMLSETTGMALDKIVYWGMYAGAAYMILDPLAPNWAVEETRLDPDLVHYRMKMKRFYNGGAGEARLILDRRAKIWLQGGKYSSYQIVEYKESLDSSLLGPQRITEAVIRLAPNSGA